MIFQPITTERLILRKLNVYDAEQVFKYRSDSETNKYQGWVANTIEDVNTFISKLAIDIDIPNTWFQLAIIRKDRNELIGDMGIHTFEDGAQAEFGITLDKNFHGCGYAAESLYSIIDYLFNNLNKHRVIASIDPRNMASIALTEKLRFRKEAHFIQSIFINNEWVDDAVYALLGSEWGKSAE